MYYAYFFGILAVQVRITLGGSAAWEVSLQHQPPGTWSLPPGVPSKSFLHEINNSSELEQGRWHGGSIHKRWFGIQSSTGETKPKLWPDKTITYCFDSASSETTLESFLQEARDKWYDSGLPADFKYVKASDEVCRNQRAKVLLISANTNGLLETTPGVWPAVAGDPDRQGPTMKLDPSPNVGLLDTAANFAHELGHAWGLLHEHQNPVFWNEDFHTGWGIGSVFTLDHWHPQNLKDYARVEAEVRDHPRQSGDDINVVTRIYGRAADYHFSAADWLPITNFAWSDYAQNTGRGPDDVDWNSIMIYPSRCGGAGSAVPGNDQRAIVLLKPDGSEIGYNLNPSPQDVHGLIKLYNEGSAVTSAPVLPSDPKSKLNSAFRKIISRRHGCQ